jgi:predicted DCC family thiol-disulfide oxidoreductase YuxK
MTSQRLIILFDGICNFCNFWIDNSDLLHFKSEKGEELLKEFKLSTSGFETFVLIDEDKFHIKSTTALKVLKNPSGLWKVLYVSIVIPKPIRDFAYCFNC